MHLSFLFRSFCYKGCLSFLLLSVGCDKPNKKSNIKIKHVYVVMMIRENEEVTATISKIQKKKKVIIFSFLSN